MWLPLVSDEPTYTVIIVATANIQVMFIHSMFCSLMGFAGLARGKLLMLGKALKPLVVA
jgi:hypothetical protein